MAEEVVEFDIYIGSFRSWNVSNWSRNISNWKNSPFSWTPIKVEYVDRILSINLKLAELLSPYQKRRSATDMSGTEGSEVRVTISCCVGCDESFQ